MLRLSNKTDDRHGHGKCTDRWPSYSENNTLPPTHDTPLSRPCMVGDTGTRTITTKHILWGVTVSVPCASEPGGCHQELPGRKPGDLSRLGSWVRRRTELLQSYQTSSPQLKGHKQACLTGFRMGLTSCSRKNEIMVFMVCHLYFSLVDELPRWMWGGSLRRFGRMDGISPLAFLIAWSMMDYSPINYSVLECGPWPVTGIVTLEMSAWHPNHHPLGPANEILIYSIWDIWYSSAVWDSTVQVHGAYSPWNSHGSGKTPCL